MSSSPSSIGIGRVGAYLFRAPIDVPVRTSFGTMVDRPMLYVRVEDRDGAIGWGEVWCNFPSVGAEYRKRLIEAVVGPLLVDIGAIAPASVFQTLMDRLHVLAIQSGDWGPLAQVCAGLDAACHDLAARRAGLPLFRYLNDGFPKGRARSQVECYASGIGPETPAATIARARNNGHTAFKVKVGFGDDIDTRTVISARAETGPAHRLMADANQGWDLDQALRIAPALAAHGLAWLEEPLRADRPVAEWQRLAGAVPAALAAGENLVVTSAFETAVDGEYLGFVQPDVAKWGGVSGCLAIARYAASRGVVYCPHFLGGAVGLMTSAHLLAAAGGVGLLEVDVNPNAIRDDHLDGTADVVDGKLQLGDRPGIGIDPGPH